MMNYSIFTKNYIHDWIDGVLKISKEMIQNTIIRRQIKIDLRLPITTLILAKNRINNILQDTNNKNITQY